MLILYCIAIPPTALQPASYPPARQLLQKEEEEEEERVIALRASSL
jgi:hypothetical protein